MSEFPINPQLANMLLASEAFKVSNEAIIIAAMLSSGSTIFYRTKDKEYQANEAQKNFYRNCSGDHIALMKIYNEWRNSNYSTQFCFENFIQIKTMKRAHEIFDQLYHLMEQLGIKVESRVSDHDSIRQCITAGFFHNVAHLRKDGSYQTMKNPITVYIHPSSGLFKTNPNYVVYHEMISTCKNYIRVVTEIKLEWLASIA